MSERVGAAERPRERGLRAWESHERLTAAMELAPALHHTAQRPKLVVEVPSEGVVGETYSVSRQQMPASPGTRPVALREPGPQVAVEHSSCPCSSGAPLLDPPSLAPVVVHDEVTVAFLLTQPLVQRQTETDIRKEKEEAKLKQLEWWRRRRRLEASAALVAENERFGRARQVRHASLGASSSSTAVKEMKMKQERGGNETRGGLRGRGEADG